MLVIVLVIPFQGHVSATLHKHNICFPEGGSGFRGDGDELIMYSSSLNQHSTRRSVNLESQSCTGDPQPLRHRPSGFSTNQEQLSDEEEIKHKHGACVSLAK